MASGSWDELSMEREKEAIGGNEHRFDLVFRQRCEHAVDLANASGGEGDKSQTKHVRGCLQVAQLRFRIRIVRIDERADYDRVGDKFVQYFQVLRPQPCEHKSDHREIARWSVKTRYEIRCDWITASYENNRYCLSCSLCGSPSHQVGKRHDPYPIHDQIPRQGPQFGRLTLLPTMFLRSIPAPLHARPKHP